MYSQRLILSAAFALSALAVAQQAGAQGTSIGVQPQDLTCAFNFTSGAARTTTTYCVTANGNITQFSVSASPTIEFLNAPNPPSEGYGLCDSTNPFNLRSYYDYARTGSGNWSPATAILQNPGTVLVTRTTADGIWKLTQTITQGMASSTLYGTATITMALTNLSGHDRFAVLQRHVNVDAGGSTLNDFNNTEVTTTASLSGNWGFMTTGGFETHLGDFNIGFNQNVPDGPDVCALNTHVVQGFFEGDGSSEQRFGIQIPAGKTKLATVVYRPI